MRFVININKTHQNYPFGRHSIYNRSQNCLKFEYFQRNDSRDYYYRPGVYFAAFYLYCLDHDAAVVSDHCCSMDPHLLKVWTSHCTAFSCGALDRGVGSFCPAASLFPAAVIYPAVGVVLWPQVRRESRPFLAVFFAGTEPFVGGGYCDGSDHCCSY